MPRTALQVGRSPLEALGGLRGEVPGLLPGCIEAVCRRGSLRPMRRPLSGESGTACL
jgi:hypothetical protein